ncbi:NitT/TauT family transport system ATP-binding protein [Geosporobacter subterraneus DSM 17957]|uniref:NitT/TauT family transport system ATP-binding protein n=1 Tax=Geosporobacter subterraneus DSM 17957 TaxID=1121919 RepID=A0A1M6I0U3_9FIRM|nr:ATP-binding cassette domain-containing protein [Geosporobacter subterraneus]SHJ28068.1 NitT/TauT family transport system ATP-binding protein [Geosporobacter subterraneus DSM 17957]
MELLIKDLHKNYGSLEVIAGLNIALPSGRIHCVFGPSGCGKTTLMNILTGLIQPDKGEIQGFSNKTFSYIFQEDRLLPWCTVEENLLFVLENRYERSEAVKRVDKYLSLVDLERFRKSYPEELSGGMRQRVTIARAFAYGGDIFAMDEPFKGLHLELKKTLMDYIIHYWYDKKPFFIFITHDIDEALYLADDIYVFQGPPLNLEKQITIDIPHIRRECRKEQMNHYKALLMKK